MRLVLAVLLALSSLTAAAQSLRIRSSTPKVEEPAEAAWSGYARYGVLTDLNESESPRAYTQSIRMGTNYKLDSHFSVAADASVRYETLNGQIDKGQEQTYTESVNPSTAIEVDYDHSFFERHSYTLFLHGEPLWDQPSRYEGYKGIAGGGGSLVFSFFEKRWTLNQVLDVSELMNSYAAAIDGSANPDLFFTYKLSNSVRLYEALRLSYTFGLKVTRYMDDFIGYSYDNTLSLSTTWQHWGFALAYENGGFTDNGDVSLWYIDEYRRLVAFSVNYGF
jgi:hypothetical protein